MNKSHRKTAVRRKATSPSLASIATDLEGLPDPAFIERLENDLINSLSEPTVNAAILQEMARPTRRPAEGKLTLS